MWKYMKQYKLIIPFTYTTLAFIHRENIFSCQKNKLAIMRQNSIEDPLWRSKAKMRLGNK